MTAWVTSTTVYSVKLETHKKWCNTSPFISLNLLVPSLGMSGESLFPNTEQLLLFSDSQSLHSPQFGRNTGNTISPSTNSSTCSPTLSTTLTNENPKLYNTYKLTNYLIMTITIIALEKRKNYTRRLHAQKFLEKLQQVPRKIMEFIQFN